MTTIVEVFGISQTVVALAPQDVLVSTHYITDGIGVVYSNTITSCNLNNIAAAELQIPASSTQTQEEFLETYLINLKKNAAPFVNFFLIFAKINKYEKSNFICFYATRFSI